MSDYVFLDNNRFIEIEEIWCLISGDLYDKLNDFGRMTTLLPVIPDISSMFRKSSPDGLALDLTEEWVRAEVMITERMDNGLPITYKHTVFVCDGGVVPSRFFNVTVR